MRYYILFLILVALILTNCKREENECNDIRIDTRLSSDAKTWLDFASINTLTFSDSIGNQRSYNRILNRDTILLFECGSQEQISLKFIGDSCPYEFFYNLSSHLNDFSFHETVGLYTHYGPHCYSTYSFDGSSPPTSIDSISLLNQWFYNIYQFHYMTETIYFTKSQGIVAFNIDSTLWLKN